MRLRDAVLQYRYALNNDGVWTIPINVVDPITEIKIWFFATTDSTGPNEAGCIPYLINEVALIDGSEVVASLSGPQAFAAAALNTGEAPYHHHQEQGGMNNYWCLPLRFGRFLEDPEVILDPTRFRNLQLRIEWDLAEVAAVGADGWADGSAQVSVWAKIMEEGANPRGYLMTKGIKSYVTEASGDEVTYLPTDFDIRKLFFRTYKKGGSLTGALENVKLSIDEDRIIPFDLNMHDFCYLMRDWFDEIDIHLRNRADDNEEREHYNGVYCFGQITGGEQDYIVNASGFANNIYTLHVVNDGGVSQTGANHFVQTSGVNVFDTACYPFGDQMDRADWLTVAPIGNLRFIQSQAAADYDAEIWVEQYHPY